MWQARLIKYLPHLVLLVLITVLAVIIYKKIERSGFEKGSAVVQAKWDEQTEKYNAEIKRLTGVIAEKEKTYRANERQNTHELAEATKRHDVAMATAHAEYAERLRLSTERAAVYQRQAQGGSLECGNLASHASKLDASLEEGRSLVRELRTTLELRDGQIQALSNQINNDRLLLNTEN